MRVRLLTPRPRRSQPWSGGCREVRHGSKGTSDRAGRRGCTVTRPHAPQATQEGQDAR